MKSRLVFLLAAFAAFGRGQEALPSIEEKVKGYELKRGLMNLYIDAKRDSILMELPAPNDKGVAAELLYVEGLVNGLGSNDVGLDRGQIGDTQVLQLKVMGRRVLFEAQNLRYRAETGSPEERQAVRESFASSVIWSGKVVAENADGRRLIDLTPFVVRDAHDLGNLQGFGRFSLDTDRSAFDPAACLAFPKNLEFEAVLTYSVASPPSQVAEVTPSSKSVTLVQHQSLIALPEPGYSMRKFDPRSGVFGIAYADYSTPIDQPLLKLFAGRFRLQKVDPSAAKSKVVKPIVYYVDNAAPEPIRSALLEGARWWSAAFEAAGFIDAFKVEVLPAGVHPLDIRYNVIQWVHRSTRGWSYGGGVSDPRTGEILKGHVTLGSLRVRQDLLIFEGLLGVAKTGSGAADDPMRLSLARIKQLAAHELGHTLGFAHNFAASTYGRASVMDYPAPLVTLDSAGRIDASKAYAEGIGEWDKFMVAYGYSQFAPGANEDAELDKLVEGAIARKMLFLTDSDTRAPGAAHPLAALWDNGSDPLAELQQVMAVRKVALDSFGQKNLRLGRPMALLEEVLAPIYFFHRYEVETAAKMVGGYKFGYKVNGDQMGDPVPVDGARQRLALRRLLDTVSPSALALPEDLVSMLQPRPFGYGPNRELFPRQTGAAFDQLSAASAAADLALSAILDPERSARVVELHMRDKNLPSLPEVLATVSSHVFQKATGSERDRAIRESVQDVLVADLLNLSEDSPVGAVKAAAANELAELKAMLGKAGDPHANWLAQEIARYQSREFGALPRPRHPAPAPPGMPIGMCDWGG